MKIHRNLPFHRFIEKKLEQAEHDRDQLKPPRERDDERATCLCQFCRRGEAHAVAPPAPKAKPAERRDPDIARAIENRPGK